MDSNSISEVTQACSPSSNLLVQHPVLFLFRSDSTSMYHHWEDAVHLFISLHVMKDLQAQVLNHGLEVVITDFRWPGPFLSFWQRISAPYPVRFLYSRPFPNGTCFQTALHSPFVHGHSLYSDHSSTAINCASHIMVAATNWIQGIFSDLLPQLPHPEYFRSWASSKSDSIAVGTHGTHGHVRMNIVFISRSVFETINAPKLTSWQQSRVFSAETDLLIGLQRFVVEWNKECCMMKQALIKETKNNSQCRDSKLLYDLVVLEGSDVSLADQVHTFMRTAVIIGMHGAGLTGQIFMPEGCRAVLEIFLIAAGSKCESFKSGKSTGNLHYLNLARLIDAPYEAVTWPAGSISTLCLEALLGSLRNLLQKLDQSQSTCARHMGVLPDMQKPSIHSLMF